VAARARSAAERSRNEAALRELNETLRERVETALRERASTEEALRQAQKTEAVGHSRAAWRMISITFWRASPARWN
jgi:hypothetical protein